MSGETAHEVSYIYRVDGPRAGGDRNGTPQNANATTRTPTKHLHEARACHC
jgi:hypothetical protein